jgi:hypothetical protein
MSDMMAERGLGRTVPPGGADLLAEAILEMLADENLRGSVSERAQAVRDELTWTRCVEPIAAFLDRVAFAPDALDATRKAFRVRQASNHMRSLERKIERQEQEMQSAIQAWEQERKHLSQAWEQEKQSMSQAWEQQKQSMSQAWEQEKQGMMDAWEGQKQDKQKQIEYLEERVEQLEELIEAIKQGRVMRLLNALSPKK